MKLPIVEAVRTAPTGKVVPLTSHMSWEISAAPALDTFIKDRAVEIRSKATFEVRQLSHDIRETEHLDRQAKRMMMHEIYGPVEDRLREILHMLYEKGPMYDDKIILAIDALINDLRP